MNNGKKILLIFNILTIINIIFHNHLYQCTGYKMELKVTCSLMFVLIGIINLLYSILSKQENIKFYIFMCIGLIFACFGDYLILFDYVKGAAHFALGNIAFVIAYCGIEKMRKRDILVSSGLFIACLLFILYCPLLNFDNDTLKTLSIIYALIICLMVGKAIGNLIQDRNMATRTIALSSILFLFSDLMLVLAWFVKKLYWAENLSLTAYYPALSFLAFSMLLMALYKNNFNFKQSNA